MKKKAVAAYWVIALSLVLVSTLSISDKANAQLLDRTLSVSLLAQRLQTPDQIVRYMWKNFAYEPDQRNFGVEDHWQTPEEFLETQKGDCEDFARFAYEMLKINGYDAFLLNVYGERFAHTVVVFKENGKYQVIDGTDVHRYNAEYLNELSSKIYTFWEKSLIVSPSANGTSVLAEFTKRMHAERHLETFS